MNDMKHDHSSPFPVPLRHESLQNLNCEVTHGIFNRFGGVSPPPYDSLNLSYNVGDDPDNVRRNRERIKKILNVRPLLSTGQVHGTAVLTVEERMDQDREINGYDALITNIPGTALMVQLADCQSVMIVDPRRKAIANIHCGWRGNVADIISRTIQTMRNRFRTRPENLSAVISPSLGPCCAEFRNYRHEFPRSFYQYQVRPNYFDLGAISRDQLCRTGIKPGNIHSFSICTRCNAEWFSYRRDRNTGRFATVIGLRK